MTTRELQERFEALVQAHRGILFKICNAYCRNHEDREDLAQEILVQLWRSFRRFDERRKFSTWMYRIALNVAISFFRRERTRARHLVAADVQLLEVIDERAAPPLEILQLHALIEEFDSLHKALLLLYLDGNSHREIAEVLGISEGNVATKLSRLKQRMRETVSDPERA